MKGTATSRVDERRSRNKKKKREKMERTGTFSIFSSTICNLGVGRDFAGAGKVTNDPNP